MRNCGRELQLSVDILLIVPTSMFEVIDQINFPTTTLRGVTSAVIRQLIPSYIADFDEYFGTLEEINNIFRESFIGSPDFLTELSGRIWNKPP